MSELFLSHAAADAALAEFLERELRSVLPEIDIFRTTRTGQIKAGKEWLAIIQQHLLVADRFLVLLTPASCQRPWIAFETGAAWAREQILVPAVAAGLKKSDVPEPLRSLQLLSLEDPREAVQIFQDLGGTLENPSKFVGHVQQLGRIVRGKALEDQGWDFIKFEEKIYAWDGPLEDLKEGQPRPLPEKLPEALRTAGLGVRSGIQGDLLNEYSRGFTLLYEIDDRQRKHVLVDRSTQITLVLPKNAGA